MSTQTITEFLEARIAEDEAVAREISECESHDPDGQGFRGTIMQMVGEPTYGTISVDPARVLAECAAKRAIIADWPDVFGAWSADEATAARAVKELTRKRLAAVYAEHADYQPGWAL